MALLPKRFFYSALRRPVTAFYTRIPGPQGMDHAEWQTYPAELEFV